MYRNYRRLFFLSLILGITSLVLSIPRRPFDGFSQAALAEGGSPAAPAQEAAAASRVTLQLSHPVVKVKIAQEYDHPYSGNLCSQNRVSYQHTGVDYSAAGVKDPEVLAAAPGEVVAIPHDTTGKKLNHGLGNVVILKHDTPEGPVYTLYAHLKSIRVAVFNRLDRGEPLGVMGSTGTDSIHLHFEMKTAPVLGNPSGGIPCGTGTCALGTGFTCWGYVKSASPDGFGYYNPLDYVVDTSLIGYHDGVSCNWIYGWAMDRNDKSGRVNVDIYDGDTRIKTVTANEFRQDLKTAGVGDGSGTYAFNFRVPDSLKGSRAHLIRVKFADIPLEIYRTPRVYMEIVRCSGGGASSSVGQMESDADAPPSPSEPISLPSYPDASVLQSYEGSLDSVSCTGINGWVVDRDNLDTPVTVELYDGDKLLRREPADEYRQDISAYVDDEGKHGFNIPTPASLFDGQPHTIRAVVAGSGFSLTGSQQTLTCPLRSSRFEGSLDVASCETISGWAADRNAPNEALDVDIYADDSFLTRIPADSLRPDVGSYLGDNGLHGFTLLTPLALRDGRSHTLSVRPASTNINLGTSPKTIFCNRPVANYEGYLDFADCNVIRGWVADKSQPNVPLNVDILDGNTPVATVPADRYRRDLQSYLSDNGLHDFNVPTPQSLLDGQTHTIRIRITGTGTVLNNVPVTLSCNSKPPAFEGVHDFVDCNYVAGWVRDVNNPGTRLNVSVYDDATGALLSSGVADQFRQDLVNAGKGDGIYGFFIPTPAALKNGQTHNVRVKVTGTAYSLGATPKTFNSTTSCTTPPPAPPNYIGYVDSQTCTSIFGWAADRNRLNTSFDVKVYDGATLIATVPANQSRPDVGTFIGDNGLHGFSIPTPAILKDGQAHSVSVRFESSASNLTNSPKALTCANTLPLAYEGVHDFVDCNYVAGWVRDVNNPGTRLNVSVYDDATGVVLASGTADQFRQDLVNAGKGDGKYGFFIPTPAGLKDGQNHAVRVKVTGSSYSLVGTPKTFNSTTSCSTPPPAPPNYVGYVDGADCNSIGGWAADRNRLNTPIDVKVYDGATLVATVPANQSRPDVGSYLKDNGLHGFSLPTPAALKSGTHTLSIRFESSGTNLVNSPKTLTCTSPPPPPPVYEGFHDFVDCNYVAGWVRNVNSSGTRLNVSVIDDATGATVASGVADQLRQDLVSAGKGDGRYGFFIPTPAGLKNGQSHAVRVKVTDTNFSLSGTPKTFNSAVTCPPPSSPDLVVTDVSGSSPVTAGGSINVSATVLNQGGAATGSFRLGIYLSTDAGITTSDTIIGTCNIGGLSAGASQTCSGSVTMPQLSSGTYIVGAIADDLNVVVESNEGNNTRASNTVTVGGGGGVPNILWEFNTFGNFEGWSAVNASDSAVHDGILFVDPAGADPNLVSGTLSVNAASYRTVVIKMASNALDQFGNVYFKTQSENSYSADKRVEFTVQNCPLCGTAPFITYTLNMSANSKWTGTITGLRIDPANDGKSGTNTDSIGFDFIRLTP
jgi:murein DD-endopeptidase MepM/ murein hydrolase activator NlpD